VEIHDELWCVLSASGAQKICEVLAILRKMPFKSQANNQNIYDFAGKKNTRTQWFKQAVLLGVTPRTGCSSPGLMEERMKKTIPQNGKPRANRGRSEGPTDSDVAASA